MAYVRLYEVINRLFSKENLWALALALMLIALVIFTADFISPVDLPGVLAR